MAGLQIAQRQAALGNAFQAGGMEARGLRHPPDLPVAPLWMVISSRAVVAALQRNADGYAFTGNAGGGSNSLLLSLKPLFTA